MRTLAVLVLLLNITLWYVAAHLPESDDKSAAGSGSLPRVTSLKLTGKGGALSPEAATVSCVALGWFESRADAKKLAEGDTGLSSGHYEVFEGEQALPPLHWVLIPPQPHPVAQIELQELEAKGVDAYLVTEGENRNAISLGLFESREAAISMLEEKKQKNLNAVLAKFTRNQVSYGLSFEVRSDSARAKAEELASARGTNFDFIEINECKGLAKSENTP
ncbi:hypothetical protein HLV39_14850 [Marinobacter adhaerens]|uniref:SPOR domain-containing protein n=1 Tax=Marinobacter adhaerens TaxID=1033846 RepID=A0A851HSV8_9GAMM|nr:hypothetical protein [Marinobacter adhaerens]NWN92769.1 hypothetical protein [Marinobacter adhaerens]